MSRQGEGNDLRVVRRRITCTRVYRRAIISVSGVSVPTRKAIVEEYRRRGGSWARVSLRHLADSYFAVESESEHRYRSSGRMGPLPAAIEELHRRRLVLESELGDYEMLA